MQLRTSPASPFGRKANIALRWHGLEDRISLEATNPVEVDDSLRRQNPASKIPVLVTDDGMALYDSSVICEYLDDIGYGPKLFPPQGEARYRALVLHALADAMLEASLLQVYEGRFRPEATRDANWVAYQADKVARALAALEETPPEGAVTIGHVALACALGYLDFRFAGTWRETHPRLVAWLADFEGKVPAFARTAPA